MQRWCGIFRRNGRRWRGLSSGPPRFRMKKLLLVLLLVYGVPVLGQDTSLTKEFSKLSAKERSRIAREEEERAAQDKAFQTVMEQAEALFRQQRYEESLDKYKEARTLRPFNVYPKVKIQDLQALLDRRAAEEAAAAPDPQAVEEAAPEPPAIPATSTVESPVKPPAEPIKEPPVQRTDTAPAYVAPPPPPATREEPPPQRLAKERPAADTMPAAPVPARVVEPRSEPMEEEYERIIREGRAVVIERRVLRDGRPVTFRKVTHPWGEVVHFRDGIAIPSRTWDEEFGD
jgi:hypothetical protein